VSEKTEQISRLQPEGPWHVHDSAICQFFQAHKNHRFLGLTPLYGVPLKLLTELRNQVPELMTTDDWKFENDLTKLCTDRSALGFDTSGFLPRSLIFGASDVPFTDADARILSEITGNASAAEVATIKMNVDTGLQNIRRIQATSLAYIGWLITNPDFVRERDEFKNGWAGEKSLSRQRQEDFRAFLGKWQLSRLVGFELPCPQGPLPAGIGPSNAGMAVSVPFGLGADAHRAVQESMMNQAVPEHLRGWDKVVKRESGKFGPTRYEDIFQIRFYRDIVLERHADGFRGNIGAIDRAFGEFLFKSVDAIRKVRTSIRKRLRSWGAATKPTN
jgi:hypothetical protein